MPLSYQNIEPFLNGAQNKLSRWFSYIGLGLGVLLLLCSVQLYININNLIRDKNTRKNGADFIAVTKTITNDNMGKDNRFTTTDIKELKAKVFIEDAAPLIANSFKVTAGAGDLLPFSTDIFIEAINEKFIDTVPENFIWQEGQDIVPVIFSTDFLEMYNVFAPSWDLPQLSEKTAMAITIFLRCHGHNGEQLFKARIVGFSDRISSVLVPENFLVVQNKQLEGLDTVNTSRVYLKTSDANNPALLNYLTQKNYHINKDKTKFGRVKGILQNIVGGLAVFGVLVILLAMLLFSFYLQLMIAKSKANLQLLLTLGYSPDWLSKIVAKKWVPVYATIIMVAVILTQIVQLLFHHFAAPAQENLSLFINWSVIAIALALLVLSVVFNFKIVKQLLHKL